MDFFVKYFTTSTGEIELGRIIVMILLSIITAIVSILTSFITTIINSNRNKKTTYVNTITSNRIKWMQDLKGLSDSFIGKTQVSNFYPIYNDLKGRIHFFEELSSIRNKLFLHLNYRGYLDDKIMTTVNTIFCRIEIIYEIDNLLKLNDFNDKMKYIFKHYHKDISNKLLESVEINPKKRKEILEYLENSKDVPKILQESINKQITHFNSKYRSAPRRIAQEVQDLHNQLIMFIQIYLKLEWDRVKDESKGKLKSPNEKDYKEIADVMIEGYNLKLYDYSNDKLPDYLR